MSTGDGLACMAGAIIIVGSFWAGAWVSVKNSAIRAGALDRITRPKKG